MTHLDLLFLPLLPRSPFLFLVVGFGVPSMLLALKPGAEEGGGGEVGLHVADDLSGGYVGWFVNC